MPAAHATPIRRAIPRALTLANAFFGFLAIAAIAAPAPPAFLPDAASGAWGPARAGLAAVCLALALACDALDGRVARWLGVASALGGELDSLADAVSFGVAPALVILCACGATPLAVAAALAHLGATLYRLARFNTRNDPAPRAHRSFEGLPCTIAAAVVVAGAAASAAGSPLAAVLALAVAPLMVSRFPYAHLLSRLEGRPLALGAVAAAGAALVAVAGFAGVLAACAAYAASGPLRAAARLGAG